jgi:hypothetical protein
LGNEVPLVLGVYFVRKDYWKGEMGTYNSRLTQLNVTKGDREVRENVESEALVWMRSGDEGLFDMKMKETESLAY